MTKIGNSLHMETSCHAITKHIDPACQAVDPCGFDSPSIASNIDAQSITSRDLGPVALATDVVILAEEQAAIAKKQQLAAVNIQKRIRGKFARRMVNFKTVVPGVLHVKLHGDNDFFDRIGIPKIGAANGSKTVEYLVLSNKRFTPHLAGGKEIYHPTSMSGRSLLKVLSIGRSSRPRVTAFVNGGFYNSANLGTGHLPWNEQQTYPEHAPIGENKVVKVKNLPWIPVQQQYQSAYRTIRFRDGSCVSSGPLLAAQNERTNEYQNLFTENEAAEARYQLSFHTDRPGQLGHAEMPHARSAISVPADFAKPAPVRLSSALSAKTHSVRLAAGKHDVRRENRPRGFTMVEWAAVMHRLGSFNENPGMSLNLDGGASTIVGVVDSKGKKLVEIRGSDDCHSTTTSFIAFSETNPTVEGRTGMLNTLKRILKVT